MEKKGRDSLSALPGQSVARALPQQEGEPRFEVPGPQEDDQLDQNRIPEMVAPARRGALPVLPPQIKRTRPRDYVEWKTLRRWGKLPPWEDVFPGYLLRAAREEAGLTVSQMAERLGCNPDEIAQAEEPQSNPTVSFLKAWAEALGRRLEIVLAESGCPDES